MPINLCLLGIPDSRMSKLSKDTKGKTGMCTLKRNFRRPTIKKEKFEGKTPEIKGHIFGTCYALQADLYMNTAKKITKHADRTCKQPKDIMGVIKNLIELVFVSPTTTTLPAMNDPDNLMDQATLKICLSKEIGLYLKRRDNTKKM
eukprot:14560451-Ditylum_brightwellii.AAC.1